ncbi:MAG: gliding motility-associated C-terminal domain-containing protein, partial [Bacteroidales bacterium]
DTICNDDRLNIELTSITQPTRPVRFRYEIVKPGSVTVTSGDVFNLPNNFVITDSIHNELDNYQYFDIIITPYTRLAASDDVHCDNGIKDTVRIWVNPTPKIFASVDDTVYCNNSTVPFTLSSPTIATDSVLYNLQVNISGVDGDVNGYVEGTRLAIQDFADSLVNITPDVQTVTYAFTPFIRNADKSFECNNGIIYQVAFDLLPTLNAFISSDSSFIGIDDPLEIRCHGWNTGKINLHVEGGMIAYPFLDSTDLDFNWSNGAVTQNQTGLAAGMYSVKVTDPHGCIVHDTIRLDQPDALDAVIDETQKIVCGQGNRLAIKLNIDGGTPGYAIEWDHPTYTYIPDNTDTAYNLPPGRYTAFIRDTNQCYYSTARSFDAISTLKASVEGTMPYSTTPEIYYISCHGASDGVLTVDFDNNYGPVTFVWTYPDGTVDTTKNDFITGLPAGKYELFAFDSLGCTAESDFDLIEPDPIEIDLKPSVFYEDSFHISCHGYSDGHITPVVTGGSFHYNYIWEDESGFLSDDTIIHDLSPGTYYLTIRDTGQYHPYECFAYDTITLVQPQDLNFDTVFTDYNGYNISCHGSSTGSVSLENITGGSTPYSFEWSTGNGSGLNGESTPEQSGLTAGNYRVTIGYGNDCAYSYDFDLDEPVQLGFTPEISDYTGYEIRCYNDSSGQVNPNAHGGVRPYQFDWSTDDGGNIADGDSLQNNLTEGTYTLLLTDDNNCRDTLEVSLKQPGIMQSDITAKSITCTGIPDGAAYLDVSGGVPGYSYNWFDMATGNSVGQTRDITEIDSGYYSVVIADTNLCLLHDTVFIDAPPMFKTIIELLTDYNGYGVSCHDAEDGSAKVSVEGGVKPYRFEWSTGNNSNMVSGLSGGPVTVVVTDGNNCKDTLSIDVSTPEPLESVFEKSNVSCFGGTDGSINATIYGGIQPYRYHWSNADTTSYTDSLEAGNYMLIVADRNNCLHDSTVVVEQPDRIQIGVEMERPYCPETYDGSIFLETEGGMPPYFYEWSDGSSDDYITQALAGRYDITITDMNNCVFDTTLVLKGLRELCLNIPSGFTPNGDGDNDTWVIMAGPPENESQIKEFYEKAVIEVYNRYGQLVFKSDEGYTEPWNGYHKGQPLPLDSYYYIIDLQNGSRAITGTVTIVK